MFGYVKPYVPELKIKEYECFRAVYCGLCRAMGKVSGQMSRLTLSYDFVFFVMMRMALTGEKPEFEEFRCPVNFTKKRQYMRLSEGSAYSAVLSSVLAKEKNSDDLNDEKGTKRLKALLLSPFFTHFLAKSKKNRKYEYKEEFGTETSKLLYELGKLENEGCQSLDETAEAFGNLLAYILSFYPAMIHATFAFLELSFYSLSNSSFFHANKLHPHEILPLQSQYRLSCLFLARR